MAHTSPPAGRVRPVRLSAEQLEDRSTPAFVPGAAVVVGADANSPPLVRVIDPTTQIVQTQFLAYEPNFYGGVRVAVGDVTGDAYPDLVVAPGPGGGPVVKVYDGATGAVRATFFALDPSFVGGVFVAAGDVDGDGRDEVIASAGPGGGPQVGVFDGTTGAMLGAFFAYDAAFTGGVRVGAGDTDGDGADEVFTVPGVDGGPAVTVVAFRPGGSFTQLASIYAYDPSFRGGMYVAGGDVTGDGRADVITGTGLGGGPAVGVYTTAGTQLASFFAYDASFRGGVRVAAADLTGDGVAEIVTGAGPGGGPQANVFEFGSVVPTVTITGLSPDQRVGIQVAASGQPLNIPATPEADIAAAYAQLAAAQEAARRARTQPPPGQTTVIGPVFPFFGAGFYDPFFYDPLFYDPFFYDVGYYEDYYYDPGYYDPGYYDPGYYDPGYYYDPGFGDFGFDPGIIDV